MSLADAIKAAATNQRLEWDAWFPIAHASASDPQSLADAVGALAPDEQYDLLDNLKSDGGPLADYLLCVLAGLPEVFADDQLRTYALEDSATALERRKTLLTELADSLQSTTDRLNEQRQEGFSLATAIANLEEKRNTLRAEQLDTDFVEMNDLEWEIARLEMQNARLGRYDAPARTTRRDEIRAETAELRERTRSIEGEIDGALRARDEAASALAAAELAQTRVQEELVAQQRRNAECTADAARLDAAITELRASSDEVDRALDATRSHQSELVAALQAQEVRLAQLRSSPLGDDAERLGDQIRALYQQLPADLATPMFQSAPRRTR